MATPCFWWLIGGVWLLWAALMCGIAVATSGRFPPGRGYIFRQLTSEIGMPRARVVLLGVALLSLVGAGACLGVYYACRSSLPL